MPVERLVIVLVDIVLIACSHVEFKKGVGCSDKPSSEQRLIIDKTKVMYTKDGSCHNMIKGTQLEQLDTFPYLGSLIASDSEYAKEIRARLAKGQEIWE